MRTTRPLFVLLPVVLALPAPTKAYDDTSMTGHGHDANQIIPALTGEVTTPPPKDTTPTSTPTGLAATTQEKVTINGRYSTNFPAAENPISEGGAWINGGATGLDWGDIRSSEALVFGASLPSLYGDPTATLTGTWASDQQAQGTVKVTTPVTTNSHEVELRVRTNITPHSITGYEVLCSVVPAHPYIEIVRWNGPINSFTYLDQRTGTYCANGDVLKVTAIGDVITAYKNDLVVAQGADSTYKNGSPGVGAYNNVDSIWSNFGFSDFSASNVSASDATSPTDMVSAPSGQLAARKAQTIPFMTTTKTRPTRIRPLQERRSRRWHNSRPQHASPANR
jgi:hypothetical protein